MRAVLEFLLAGGSLTEQEAKNAFRQLASGVDPVVASAFLTIYRMRTPAVEELLGFRSALLDLCVPCDNSSFGEVVDLCGTGGDGRNTFNISTAASFVVAAAGARVAKHGNYAFSSRCGASNVLEALGVRLRTTVDDLRRDLDRCGLCFIHAPFFHPALKSLAGTRKALGFRTVLNLLGPLVNPARPRRQLLGVPSLEVAGLYNAVCSRLELHYTIVHSADGYDEISLTAPAHFYTRSGQRQRAAEEMGFETVVPDDLAGGETPEDGAAILEGILNGKGTRGQEMVVIANAAAALSAGDLEAFDDARERAQEALRSGKAAQVLERLRSKSDA